MNHLVREGRAIKYRQARTSLMEVRWLCVDQIEAPSGFSKDQAISGPIYYLEVKEAADDVPPGEAPVHWEAGRMGTDWRLRNFTFVLTLSLLNRLQCINILRLLYKQM